MKLKFVLFISFIFIFISGCTQNKTYVSKKNVKSKIKKEQIKTVPKKSIPLLLDMATNVKQEQNIAIIFASKVIGKYAIDATNSVLSYLLYKNQNYDIKIFDTINETQASIMHEMNEINDLGISNVIALFTNNGAIHIANMDDLDNYNIYLPLVHKDDLNISHKSIVFGSIDYKKQFEKLLTKSDTKIVEFYDNETLGKKLSKKLHENNNTIYYSKQIDNNNGSYHYFLNQRNKKLDGSTLILNMPIIKSSMVLSQARAKDVKLKKIVSTQQNYTPLLLSLTQVQDRKKIIIANSISSVNSSLKEYASFVNSDLSYNWVNYSTIIGIEYLLLNNVDEFENIKIIDNQVVYPIELYTTTKYSFKKIN